MCGSMADIQSAAADIRRGKKKERRKKKNKPQHENIYGLLFHRATIKNSSKQQYVMSIRTMHAIINNRNAALTSII